jgi:uncharacterized protein YegP (UPF0339 family)
MAGKFELYKDKADKSVRRNAQTAPISDLT